MAKTRQKPRDGSTHWTTHDLAKVLDISHMPVARVWRRAGHQPDRFQRYMLSDDPQFEEKAADVIGRYLNPPQHAVVFAADEKAAIQALDSRWTPRKGRERQRVERIRASILLNSICRRRTITRIVPARRLCPVPTRR